MFTTVSKTTFLILLFGHCLFKFRTHKTPSSDQHLETFSPLQNNCALGCDLKKIQIYSFRLLVIIRVVQCIQLIYYKILRLNIICF